MRLPEGQTLRWRGDSTELDPLRTWGARALADDAAETRILRGEGWELEMAPESLFAYPAYPFNPYAIDGAAPPAQAVACVTASFEHGRTRTFRLKVQ